MFSSKILIFRQNIGFNLLWYMPPIAKRKKVTMLKNNNRSMTFKIQNTSIGRQQHEHHSRTKSGYWISPAAPLAPGLPLLALEIKVSDSTGCTISDQNLHVPKITCWMTRDLWLYIYDGNKRQQKDHTCTSVGWTIAIHGNWC